MTDEDAGRHATRPREIPRAGWRRALERALAETSRDNVSIIAAGVAFYVLLALFPAIAAIVSIYGLVVDPETVRQQVAELGAVLPEAARGILEDQLGRVAGGAGGALGLGAAGGILLALWSAGAGTKALMTALNVVYDEEEKRGLVTFNALALLLTLGLILFLITVLALVAALPPVLAQLDLPAAVEALARWSRWPILAIAFVLVLAVLYCFAPSRRAPRWRWVSTGAIAATVVWLLASAAFSWYASAFGSYNATYGSLGAVVVLMVWLWLSAFIVLVGGEINAALEHRTEVDSTLGPDRAMGERGARVADTVAGGDRAPPQDADTPRPAR